MGTGLLEVDCTIDLSQFWPDGNSDADTTKVEVTPHAFRFRPDDNSPFQPTYVFDSAHVKGKSGTKPILDTKGRMTARLEGIDAPELHYRPAALVKKSQRSGEQHQLYLKYNEEYRQNLAETGTRALADLLAIGGQNTLACKITTAVDEPNEVFDTYARFVGYLKVDLGNGEVVINDWLTRNGWTFPAFYSSMGDHEIVSLRDAGRQAKQNAMGLWPHLIGDSKFFDEDMVYRGKNAAIMNGADAGDLIFPKLFRRVSEHWVNKKSKMFSGNFNTFLATKSSDHCFETDDFLSQGGPAANLLHFTDFISTSGEFDAEPDELVFRESPSTLVPAGGGTPVW